MARVEAYIVKTGERAVKNPGLPGWTALEGPMIKPMENIIAINNFQMLSGKEWNRAWSRESIGGNAGEMHCGINTVVNKNTGEIIKFSNYSSDYEDPNYGEVRFKVQISYVKNKIKLFIDEVYFEGFFTEDAKRNLASAVEQKNNGQ